MSFNKNKKPIQITLDPEQEARKPKDISSEVPALDTLDLVIDIAKYASDLGVDGDVMLKHSVFTMLAEFKRLGLDKKRFDRTREMMICPICLMPGCPWPYSEEARLMGWGRKT